MRQQLTVSVDEHVLDALRRAAARDGVPEDELVDEALRRWFGLRGLSVIDEIGSRGTKSEAGGTDDAAAIEAAVREVHAARAARRSRAG